MSKSIFSLLILLFTINSFGSNTEVGTESMDYDFDSSVTYESFSNIEDFTEIECKYVLPFENGRVFRDALRAKLVLTKKDPTCIKFIDRTYHRDQLPDSIKVWMSAIEQTGGKVEYQEVSRGWLSILFRLIFRIVDSHFSVQRVAQHYNMIIQVDAASQEVIKIMFYPRGM